MSLTLSVGDLIIHRRRQRRGGFSCETAAASWWTSRLVGP